MIKKLAVVGVGAAMFLAAAVPAFAVTPTTLINNTASVMNSVNTSADTGYNGITSLFGDLFANYITTGAAIAGSTVTNQVNTNHVTNCLCDDNVTVNNGAGVTNLVNTSADTGYNEILSDSIDSVLGSVNSIVSGTALSQAAVTNVVNTNVVGL